jgi:hypothetical protein
MQRALKGEASTGDPLRNCVLMMIALLVIALGLLAYEMIWSPLS